jgi:gas vesicle protein
MMGFVLGFLLGAAAAFVATYLHAHPEKREELQALFKKKP